MRMMGTQQREDAGYPAASIDDVLVPHADIVSRIKLCYGADRQSFDADIMSMVRSYAAYVHLLPATPDNYFHHPGGLLRLGLEAGFFSLQGTDGHIIAGRSTITTRRHLEPRWRQATFIAGLCCELHRTLSHMVVEAPSGELWSGFLHPLAHWLSEKQIPNYRVRWRPQAQEVRGQGLFALGHVVPSAVLHYLAEDNTTILPHLLASVTGLPLYREHNVLDQLVRRSLALVIDCNLCANADRMGSSQLGAHIGRYLVEALQRLASSNAAWTCNGDKSRVWYGKDGLFLLWPNAAEDVKKLLESEQLPGIPRAPDEMLHALRTADAIEVFEQESLTWDICPPGSKTPVKAIKLHSAAILFTGMVTEPVALEVALIQGLNAPVAPPKPPTPASPPQPPTSAAKPPRQVDRSAAKQVTVPVEQMDLIPAESAADVQLQDGLKDSSPAIVASEYDPPPSEEPEAPGYTLQAPMRLHPATRAALLTIIQSLHGDASSALARPTSQGLFVPLGCLERQGIQPSHAIRTLAEVQMLVRNGNAPTLSQDFNGVPTIGLVIAPPFIAGLPKDTESTSIQESSAHAA